MAKICATVSGVGDGGAVSQYPGDVFACTSITWSISVKAAVRCFNAIIPICFWSILASRHNKFMLTYYYGDATMYFFSPLVLIILDTTIHTVVYVVKQNK